MRTFAVKDVTLDASTRFQDNVLRISESEIRALVLEDKNIKDAYIELARPGESTRIIHVLDAVEPRCKAEPASACFPGFLGPPSTVGEGTTHRLAGVALLIIGTEMHIPIGGEVGVLEFNEGFIDMSGPGKDLSACSDTLNICLCLTMHAHVSVPEFTASASAAGLKTADYLARTTLGKEADDVESLSTGVVNPSLPNVAYINQIQSQGLMCRTFLYGMPMEGYFTPTLLHPNELMDGAIVSANYRNLMRYCTYMQQNNSMVRELYARHGVDINFIGMVVTRGHYDEHSMKHRSGNYAAKLVKLLGAKACVLTIEGTGNSNIDYMETISALEKSGVIAVPVVHEYGGPVGDGPALLLAYPEAVSLVSGGGVERIMDMPPMDRVIGGTVARFAVDDTMPGDFDPHRGFKGGPMYYFCGFRMLQDRGYSGVQF